MHTRSNMQNYARINDYNYQPPAPPPSTLLKKPKTANSSLQQNALVSNMGGSGGGGGNYKYSFYRGIRTNIWLTFAVSFILVVTFLLQFKFDNSLYFYGVNYVYRLQQQTNMHSKRFLYILFNIISTITSDRAKRIFFCIYSIFQKKLLLVLVYLTYLKFATYIIQLLILILEQPVPFWISQRIGQYDWMCNSVSGSPCINCFFLWMVFEPILSDSVGLKRFRVAIGVGAVLVTVGVIFSRLALGTNSINQILFGLILGLALLILYKYLFQQYIYNQYMQMITNRFFFNIPRLIILATSSVILLTIPYIIYLQKYDSGLYIQSGLLQYVKKQGLEKNCSTQLILQDIIVENLENCAILAFGFGITFACLMLSHDMLILSYLFGLWTHSNNVSAIFRAIAIFFVMELIRYPYQYYLQSIIIKNSVLVNYLLHILLHFLRAVLFAYFCTKLFWCADWLNLMGGGLTINKKKKKHTPSQSQSEGVVQRIASGLLVMNGRMEGLRSRLAYEQHHNTGFPHPGVLKSDEVVERI